MSATVVRFHGLSDIGPVRSENQDLLRTNEPDDAATAASHGSLYAIADGMGGYAHGAVASATALETFFDAFYNQPAGNPIRRLRRAMEQANLAVNQAAFRANAGPMGTTLTVANICGNQLYLAHVGDSRAYLIRDGVARCLTTDHTQVAELVRMRVIGPERLRTHPQRSILSRCLGLSLFVTPDTARVTLRSGDALVLCSDGLWAWVEDADLASRVHGAAASDQLARQLIDLALQHETDDNVSVLVLRVDQAAAETATEARGALRRVVSFLADLF